MSIDISLGNVKYLTKHIKNFETLEDIDADQYLLGIKNADKGNGAKITYKNVLASSPSSQAGNLLSISSKDSKLYVEDKSGDLSALVTSAKGNLVLAVNELNDKISSGSVIADILATYEELKDYDTSKLDDGAIIEILTDSSHDNKTTFYKYAKIDDNFTYIGAISGGSGYHPNIFDIQWSDHLINDIQWLRADTFSWQSGDVYVTAYEKLVEEYDDESSVEETEGDITFKRTTNGFKIATADYESAILSKYNIDGIAWYYILDEENKRFKLPRTKFGFEGLRDNVGDDIDESLPNITGTNTKTTPQWDTISGCFTQGSSGTACSIAGTTSGHQWGGYSFDASRSSSTYQDNAPVQERATQMYLYFYVGNFSESATEQTAGINTELFNNKVDIDFNNMNPSQTAKNVIIGWGTPDYDAGVSKTVNVEYTADSAGIVYVYGFSQTVQIRVILNGTTLELGGRDDQYGGGVSAFIPLSVDDTYKFTGNVSSITFYPYKGV